MSSIQASDRKKLVAIWKSAEELKGSSIPVLRNYATHILVETSSVFDQLLMHPPGADKSDN
jgi:hypothetical protein